MKRAAPLVMGTITALSAHAQAPHPERLETCRDAVLMAAETYDFATGPSGRGGSLDWIHCATERALFTLGGASYSVGGSSWTLAKGAASYRALDTVWLSADASHGFGHGVSGRFDYFTVREGITVKAAESFYARAEHQYLHIAGDRGNVFKLAGIVQPLPPLLVELGGAASAGGNLGTRSYTGRIDWVDPRWRAFAGHSRGRTTPQVVDIVTGSRLPDTKSRQWFAGAFIPIGPGELGVSFDELTTSASRRRTWGLTLKWPLP